MGGRGRRVPARGATAPDRGTTFIEVLVSIVLMGTAVIGTLSALRASIEASDRHRAKIAAIAELQGAAGFLARESADVRCGIPAPVIADFEAILATRPGLANDGITVTIDGLDCTDGIPVLTLTAVHASGRSTETLDVVVGGISVIKDGTGGGPSGGGGSNPCVWTSASTSPPSVTKTGNNLSQDVFIILGYVAGTDCPTQTVTARVFQTGPGAPADVTGIPLSDMGAGLMQGTLLSNARNWKKGTVNVEITPQTGGPFTTSFTVL